MPSLSLELVGSLLMPAILILIISFVDSIFVAQTLAAKQRPQIYPNQELIGLGAANLGAAFTGGFPVTGGFSRSMVNFGAGSETPEAGIYMAMGLAIAALFLTPLVYFLPKAKLAASIIVAVLSLVDFSIFRETWNYNCDVFLAFLATILMTLTMGIEVGVASGVAISILLYFYKTSRSHFAEVGHVSVSQHFRNIYHHVVTTDLTLLMLRVDESLYFINAHFLQVLVQARVTEGTEIRNVIIMFSAVNEADSSALESLEAINLRLKDMNIGLHLSEVKGPVMDRLKTSHFLDDLNSSVFLSQ